MCRHASLWQLHLDSPHGPSNDHRAGTLKAQVFLYWTLTSVYFAMPLIMIFFVFDTQFYRLQPWGWVMFHLHVWGVSVVVKCTRQDYVFPSLSVCGWWLCGLIEICDSSTGYDGLLDECPWAPSLLITLGWLAVPGQCEQRRYLPGSIIYDCQSDKSLHLCYSAHYTKCQ